MSWLASSFVTVPIRRCSWPSCATSTPPAARTVEIRNVKVFALMGTLPPCSIVVFVMRGGVVRDLARFEELPRLPLGLELGGALGVQGLHLRELFGADLREVPDEAHELPGVEIVFRGTVAPGGHAGQAHAVADDVEDLAVGQGLRSGGGHVRCFRVEIASDGRVAPPV